MKLLIIRFSSLGDIAQCLVVPTLLQKKQPQMEVHWLTKTAFLPLIEHHPHIHKAIGFDTNTNWKHHWHLIQHLRKEQYTHIYDAHSTLRSHLLVPFLLFRWCNKPQLFRRTKQRLRRWLLFRWRWNLFPQPFIGAQSFLDPLQPFLGAVKQLPLPPHFFSPTTQVQQKWNLPNRYIAIVPQAAWQMKCWPLSHWKILLQLFPQHTFVVLGGTADRTKLKPLADFSHTRFLVGKTTLAESLEIIQNAKVIIGNDTGLMHAGDMAGVPALFLIGPTAFGYPAFSTKNVCEVSLACRPCTKDGRGKCHRSTWQKCLVDLHPEYVAEMLRRTLKWIGGNEVDTYNRIR